MWAGIEVWGDNSVHQNAEGGVYRQGYVELKNGAVIENAECALALWHPRDWSSTGGIVHATGAEFRNNAKTVHALYYGNYDPGTGREASYNAWFRRCTFTVDGDYAGGSTFHKHVDLDHVKGVSFTACRFSADRSVDGVSPWCMGIGAYESGFSVQGLYSGNSVPAGESDYERSSFEGFFAGVEAVNDGTAARAFSVNRTDFTDNDCGIYALNTGYATVTRNDFRVGRSAECSYGIYADNVTGFLVESNRFRPYAPTGHPAYGIAVSESQGVNDIYGNSFEGLTCGNIAVGRNQLTVSGTLSRTTLGLTYTCNSNTGNTIDFLVQTKGGRGSVQQQQGSSTLPAGNTFSGSRYHIYNGGVQTMNYYYSTSSAGSQPLAAKIHRVSTTATASTNPCDDHYGSGAVTMTASERKDRENEYQEMKERHAELHTTLERRLDGGDTRWLVKAVRSATETEGVKLYQHLMEISPYVSGTVLEEVLERNDVFGDEPLAGLLCANPDVLKGDALMERLASRVPPLPEDLLERIHKAAELTTERTDLMARIAECGHGFKAAAGSIVRSCLNDSVSVMEDLHRWLSNVEELAADRLAVAAYAGTGDYDKAIALAAAMPDTYGLAGTGLEDCEDYVRLLAICRSLHETGRTVAMMTVAERSLLETIADGGEGFTRSLAAALLLQLDDEGERSYGCHTLPGEDERNTGYRSVAEESEANFSIYPNPASSMLYINAGNAEYSYAIFNGMGQQIANGTAEGEVRINVSSMAKGVYFIRITNGTQTSMQKVVVE